VGAGLAISGAAGGAAENAVNSLLNGKTPDLASVATAAGINATFGKGAAMLFPSITSKIPDVYKTPASYSLAPQNAQNIQTSAQTAAVNATRQTDQTISSGLGGGSVQAVGGLVGRALGKP
jgi:hypothetical protein